jgi:hypothetical protein
MKTRDLQRRMDAEATARRWASEDGRVFRRVRGEDDDGRKWKTGVGEREAREIERRLLMHLRERFSMREVSVGPVEAFSKRSVKEVLDEELWSLARPIEDGVSEYQP